MKKLLISFLLAFGGIGLGSAQTINPTSTTQGTYTDRTGHSVPYALATPLSGQTTVVFDPTTSATDESNAFAHLQKASSDSSTNGQPLTLAVIPGIVGTAFYVQEARVQVPFVVNNTNSGSTLTTIPFSYPTTLQAGGHYRFEARLYINAGTGGTKIDVGGTCNTSNFVAAYKSYSTTSIIYGGQLTSFLSGPSGSSTTGQTFIEIVGELDVTNGGTFVIQFAQNAANGTSSTVLAGSTLTVIQEP